MPHGRAYSEEMMGGTPAEQPERYFNASPANFIDRIKGRLMIVHGMQRYQRLAGEYPRRSPRSRPRRHPLRRC